MSMRSSRKSKARVVPEGSAPEPIDESLAALREAARGCKRCPLWKQATQTVFGEGPEHARIMVIGEQPATRKTSVATRSSARRGNCSTAHWPSSVSTATCSMSPTQ